MELPAPESVNGKFRNITRSDLKTVGDRFMVPGHSALLDEVAKAIRQWPEFAEAAGLSSSGTTRVQQDFPVTG